MTLKHGAEILDDGEEFDPFAGGEIGLTAPITPEQEELWLSVQLGGTPANLAYNQALEFCLCGPLDAALLKRCLDTLVERHEALRTTLSGDGASLCIARSGKMALSENDLSQLGSEERAHELTLARRAAVNDEFDLVKGPLVRSCLLRLSEQEHVLILVAHHVICDGSSLSILTSELGELYSAARREKAPNLPPATPFSSYATTRAAEAGSKEAREDLDYWRERYKSLPADLELPLDRPRPPERTFAGDRIDLALPLGLARELKSTAARHGTSLATLLFGCLQAFLQRITGQRSFSLILPGAGQSISGQKALVGHCVRTLPIRAEVDPKQPFHEHLLQVRTAMLDALDHPRITFGGLVKALPLARDPSRIPLAAVAFNVDSNAVSPAFEGLEAKVASLPRSYESFEWFVSFTVSGDEIVIETCFSTTLFEKSSMNERMTEFVALLQDVAKDSSKRIGELAVMTDEQRHAVLVGNNRTDAELPTRTLCARFREVARRCPERVAVTAGGRSLSYAELDRRSAALAQELNQQGAGAGSFVGVYLERSVDLLVATLAVMRAGAAYVPLDPDYPSERVSFIAADTGLSLIVTESGLSERLPAGAQPLLVEAPRASAPLELDESQLSGAAYVIYTSGSTGRPKGAVIEHRNVANVLAAFGRRPGLGESDVMVCVASLCFDMSVPDLFLPVIVGAKLVIATEDETVDGERLARLLRDQGATLMQATPAGWRVLLESSWQGQDTLRAICAGEALPSELAIALGKRVPVLWNGYGPTECTVYTSFEQVGALPATIGTPVDNARVYVLDPSLRPVAPGVVGELYVGGAGVGRGYHQRPELD
ncbi:MAG TPA: AMP-binding protein, partial [Polyangiaceae bacterium]|nr:AMP-binding protein [Polyangiaceae bacterium]